VKIRLDSHNQNDIDNYVRASVLDLKNHNIPTELQDEIQEALIKGSNGMFLWVYLILYDFKHSTKTSTHAIHQKLNTLPKASRIYTEKYYLRFTLMIWKLRIVSFYGLSGQSDP
jgi:hypothetical protein